MSSSGTACSVFVLPRKKLAERRVRDGIERIELDLLVKGGRGFGEFLLLLKREAEIVVGVLVGRIHFDLFAKRGSGFVELAEAEIGESEIIPGLLVLRVELDDALEKRNRRARVACIQGREARFDQCIAACRGGDGGRAGRGVWITTSDWFSSASTVREKAR